jgi:hypothetical protein
MPRYPSIHLWLGLVVLGACSETSAPTQPGTAKEPALAATTSAAASNTWTSKASVSSRILLGFSAGVAPNPAGQTILYTFGGTDDEGGSGFGIEAYNGVTNTWTGKASRVFFTRLNGVGKLGSRLYFSGGFQFHSPGASFTPALYAYDYAADRLIRKADMPKATADGVTGVIDEKLYVLPGTCSGEGWPFPGYCEHEPIRQL